MESVAAPARAAAVGASKLSMLTRVPRKWSAVMRRNLTETEEASTNYVFSEKGRQ